MVVHVADEQDADGSAGLRGKRFLQLIRRLRRHDTVEGAALVAFARLVIEREHDLSADIVVVIVVVPLA